MALAALAGTVGLAGAEVEPGMAMGIDYPNGDISRVALSNPDPGLCRRACDENGACRGWAFVKPGVLGVNAVCALKGSIGSAQADQNVISGLQGGSTYSMTGGARVENFMGIGADLPGGDLGIGGTLERSDPALCAQRCEANGQCQAWTFMRAGGPSQPAVCWLKGSIPAAVGNANTISARRQTPVAPPITGGSAVTGGSSVSGAIPPVGTGFGVWAYVIGVNAGKFGDPCQIQYVAFAIPGNRFDSDPNYRRVRARFTMKDASDDVTFFSVFMQDQPDGVVKLRPCSAATTLLQPRPGGPGVLPDPMFAVWAYVIGVNAGKFGDPCQIQYVAFAIPGNRFDSDPNYRRVRARFTMKDASDDVTFFSVFMQDQPDGVVKLRPCSAATTLLQPRPGGPGVLPGPVFAVWAYTIGTATFADPCAIQYVRSQIAGNRFDGNSRYIRVAAEISGSEASRLVTRFSAFMEDQPDGVAKLISCADFKKLASDFNSNQPRPPVGKPPQEVAAWMTGTFDSGFGVTQLTPGGGTYSISNGALAVTGIKGATMEGTWTQSSSGGQCADKTHRGRFRITFTADGFSGLWSYCDKEPNMGWIGTRRRGQ